MDGSIKESEEVYEEQEDDDKMLVKMSLNQPKPKNLVKPKKERKAFLIELRR